MGRPCWKHLFSPLVRIELYADSMLKRLIYDRITQSSVRIVFVCRQLVEEADMKKGGIMDSYRLIEITFVFLKSIIIIIFIILFPL